ncbi:alpha/beta hydrolase [Streptomyces sp. DG2A-72]|uniref:alpha/beta fold hydrolase n=1 Tax=Streptomyces sp. DG2A-72 TaxID=3051386 RepID=UPI00265B7728|nr:alpha/beta hydrolase [Streptomyces sp. DG2A-72]MDO0938004.1 alpha/beta hydrolase [Streptomyces sp. DG2A-72]
MPTFSVPDGTTLAFHVSGETGPPVLCLPGGPAASAYLGDLGGLSAHRRLIRLDLRGTGESATPTDLAGCRCDRMVDDVEALRAHLGLDRVDLLAHCGGANVAVQYAARHPDRISRLVLITPSVRAVGIPSTGEDRREIAELRRGESWFPEAYAALEEIVAGRPTAASWQAIAPFSYGRWDETARAHQAASEAEDNGEVMAAFGAEGAFTPDVTRKALAEVGAPVFVLAGEVDMAAPPRVMAEFAALFPDARMVVQPRAGHFPWLDDAEWCAAAVAGFLASAR